MDLNGVSTPRLAGAATFPAQITVPLAVGPEVPREGVAAIRSGFEELLSSATVAPLQLRSRAISVLLIVGTASDELRDLSSEAAVALSVVPSYIDYIDTHQTRPTSPVADIQRNLLPARIARVGGATIAGNALPGYEIGEDWFAYTQNPQGGWLGIADSARRRTGHRRRRAVTRRHFVASAANQSIPPKTCWPSTRSWCNSVRATPPPRPRSDSGTRPSRPSGGSPR